MMTTTQRKNQRKRRLRLLLSLIILLVVAGAVGYGASRYLLQPGYVEKDGGSESGQPPPEKKPDKLACVAALPDKMKFSQKIMFAVYSDQTEAITPVLTGLGVGGVIIMDAVTAGQIAALRDAFKITPIIAVDQEGGTVQRYEHQGGLPGASDMPSGTPDQAYELYLADSKYLASLGITTNFAPVVDIKSREPSPLPGRMYSSDPDVVASYASKAIQAMKDAGIQPVIKHFPGMGSASGNTDLTSATTDPLSVLQSRDLIPYKELAGLSPDVMVGNMIVPGLTDGQPAIWSPEAIALLKELGYENSVIYSDSLTAEAVPGTIAEAALKAWSAGIDIAVIVQTRQQLTDLASYAEAIDSLGAARLSSGELDQSALNKSVERILARKGIDPCSLRPA